MKRLVLFMMAVMLLSIIVNAQKKGGKTLVAYFSATGTTARAAKLVAETVDGTLYEIQPAKKYLCSCDLYTCHFSLQCFSRRRYRNGC